MLASEIQILLLETRFLNFEEMRSTEQPEPPSVGNCDLLAIRKKPTEAAVIERVDQNPFGGITISNPPIVNNTAAASRVGPEGAKPSSYLFLVTRFAPVNNVFLFRVAEHVR